MKLALKAQYRHHGTPYRDETYLACSPWDSNYLEVSRGVKRACSILYKDGLFAGYCDLLPSFIRGLFE